ncbi:CpsD/CapB family tyrosine-protein kinase [Candidatus Venteria ishoeyi]|uniref:Tyrosine-protein kinase ptk n=1 Tax=Candidatus Venteria ishoeyi TaxID=1899563 RepID=A0A1H6FG87_9GAMM|nr:CpsD/CapB family tyrosine-protein kinase [Candidatus Venteria ishoeyi]MDM8546148.1 CpsD/CapB family tyrosine-protein kinase [Candidatus Venteria ishoeyi]SEH08014.1 Tyrosine-protein kinase ptk [Candidatus Venteria ishoeyi]
MSKIYQALQKAASLRFGKKNAAVAMQTSEAYLKTKSRAVEEQMIGLYRAMIALLENQRGWGRTVQFISSRENEGCSALSREFAKVIVRRLDTRVLLVDADVYGDQLNHFGVRPEYSWQEVALADRPAQQTVVQVPDTKLSLTQMAMPGESITQIVHAPAVENILEDLKRDFDVIIVDTPPAISSSDGLALSHKVDGVFLVVEAESTRWQIARNTREKIEIRGGNVLGVIFNKRRHYIPRFIYERL